MRSTVSKRRVATFIEYWLGGHGQSLFRRQSIQHLRLHQSLRRAQLWYILNLQ